MAQCYFFAEDEYRKARTLAMESSAGGSKYGQHALGLMELRRGARAEAAALFELAAAQNYDVAQLQLGQLYATGAIAGGRDTARASQLFHLAAEQGNIHAFEELGQLEHRSKHADECTRWCVLALDAGSDDPFVVSCVQKSRKK
jgi:TPR repeat protein